MSRLDSKTRHHVENYFFGPAIRRVLEALDKAEAKEKDLRKRLKAIRKESFSPAMRDARSNIQRISDLGVKNWEER